MQTPMSPVSEQYFNGQLTAAQLLGIKPGSSSYKAAGQALPSSDAGAGDRLTTWWSPESPTFWVALVGVLTIAGMAGADARVRLGRARLHAGVGTT